MEENNNKTKTKRPVFLAEAILIDVLAVLSIVMATSIGDGYFGFLVPVLIYTSIVLYLGRRDILPVIGIGVTAFVLLFMCFDSILNEFSWLLITSSAFMMLSCIAVLVYDVFFTQNSLSAQLENAKKVWYIPGLIGCISIALSIACLAVIISEVMDYREYYSQNGYLAQIITYYVSYLIFSVVLTLTAFIGTKRMVSTSNEAMPYTKISNRNAPEFEEGKEDNGYIDMVLHILLLIFTFGIWQIIWVYKTTKYCRRADTVYDPTAQTLLAALVPFYFLYWIYRQSQRIDKLVEQAGGLDDTAVMNTVIALFVPIVSFGIMQNSINNIATGNLKAGPQIPYNNANNNNGNKGNTADTRKDTSESYGAAEEILKYKKLLDEGAITQEEYDEKKKQLLGM